MQWFYYITQTRPIEGYWSSQAPCYVRDTYMASIVADQMPTKNPLQMQADQMQALKRMHGHQ
jgi:hypothetical protein